METRDTLQTSSEDVIRRGSITITWIAALWTSVVFGAPAATQPLEPREVFAKYCFDCHGDGESKGDIALDQMLAHAGSKDDQRKWEKAWKIVRQEFMPPADEEHPSIAERKALVQWIERNALGVDEKLPDPGRVTIRRLNRIEYEYSVSDLFGADLNTAGSFTSDNKPENVNYKRLRDRLPPDDTAFGFDNNGDFTSLSPQLLERYLVLAEWIVDQVIVQGGPRHPVQNLALDHSKAKVDETTRAVEQKGSFELEHSGPYHIDLKFTVGGFTEIAGTFTMSIRVDGNEWLKEPIAVGGSETRRYSIDLDLEKGKHTWTFTTKPSDEIAIEKKELDPNKPNVLNPSVSARLTGPIGTGIYEYPETHQRIFFKGAAPSGPTARRDYASQIIRRIADRAFRRPVDERALSRLTDIAMSSDNFERGIAQAITAVLTSPRFLYRAELQPTPDDPKSVHPIDEYALASRLSYLLWLSLPDDELKNLASAVKLRANLEAQLKRMLADKKSARFFEDFPGQWLRTRNVLMAPNSRDGAVLDPLRGAMKRETDMLFEHICRNDRDLMELITADYTFVNEKLANFYGIDGVEGDDFVKVSLPPTSHRGGVLTQGSFLMSTSNPNRTSPVKRGLYVLDTFWGMTPPPPLPNVPSLEDARVHGVAPKTISEQLAAHRNEPQCATCHVHFDPIGVALENYDLIGRWRDTEAGLKIAPHETTVSGETLCGVEDIRVLFTSRPDLFYRGLTEKLMTYSLGRGLGPSDSPTIDRIADDLVANHGKFSILLLDLVNSPQFQLRRGDNGVPVEPPQKKEPAEVNVRKVSR